MNIQPPSLHPLPPRLTMDEYADFVWETVRRGRPDRMARQKEIEERVALPFRICERAGPLPDNRAFSD